jgi:hypothetical protein
MRQDQKTKPTTQVKAKQDFKGVGAVKKVRFDPSDGDDPMLTTDCAKFFASLSPEEQQAMRDKAGGEMKLEWAFDSFDDMVKKLEAMAEAEREKLLQTWGQKMGARNGGMICFCGHPECGIGEFVPIEDVRKYRGY